MHGVVTAQACTFKIRPKFSSALVLFLYLYTPSDHHQIEVSVASVLKSLLMETCPPFTRHCFRTSRRTRSSRAKTFGSGIPNSKPARSTRFLQTSPMTRKSLSQRAIPPHSLGFHLVECRVGCRTTPKMTDSEQPLVEQDWRYVLRTCLFWHSTIVYIAGRM